MSFYYRSLEDSGDLAGWDYSDVGCCEWLVNIICDNPVCGCLSMSAIIIGLLLISTGPYFIMFVLIYWIIQSLLFTISLCS